MFPRQDRDGYFVRWDKRTGRGVSRLHVDNYLESHKPSEISDLRLLTIQEA